MCKGVIKIEQINHFESMLNNCIHFYVDYFRNKLFIKNSHTQFYSSKRTKLSNYKIELLNLLNNDFKDQKIEFKEISNLKYFTSEIKIETNFRCYKNFHKLIDYAIEKEDEIPECKILIITKFKEFGIIMVFIDYYVGHTEFPEFYVDSSIDIPEIQGNWKMPKFMKKRLDDINLYKKERY